MTGPSGFDLVPVDEHASLYRRRLPDALRLRPDDFESLWSLRPGAAERGPSRNVRLSRMLAPVYGWCRSEICGELNSLTVNWYDPIDAAIVQPRAHARHRLEGTPLVTVSFGNGVHLRLERRGSPNHRAYDLADGHVLLVPWETQADWLPTVRGVDGSAQEQHVLLTLTAMRGRPPGP